MSETWPLFDSWWAIPNDLLLCNSLAFYFPQKSQEASTLRNFGLVRSIRSIPGRIFHDLRIINTTSWYKRHKTWTYISQNYGRNDCAVISHPNVTFETFVFSSQLSCSIMKLRLAEWWNGDVVDQCSRHSDFWRHGVCDKRVHGIISKMREHLGSFLVIGTYVTFREGVQWGEQGSGRFETSKTSNLSKVDLRSQRTSETPQMA